MDDKTGKTKSKQTPTKKKAATKATKKVSKKEKALAELAANGELSFADIARGLNEKYHNLYNAIRTPEGKALIKGIEEDTANRIQILKAKAIEQFGAFMSRADLKPEVMLSALKFAIGDDLKKDEGARPEQLIFETVISETGVVEQTTRKIYHKETRTVKEEEPDESLVFEMPDIIPEEGSGDRLLDATPKLDT